MARSRPGRERWAVEATLRRDRHARVGQRQCHKPLQRTRQPVGTRLRGGAQVQMQLRPVGDHLPRGPATKDPDRRADAARSIGQRLHRPDQRHERRDRRRPERAGRADMRADPGRPHIQRPDRPPTDHQLAAVPARLQRQAGGTFLRVPARSRHGCRGCRFPRPARSAPSASRSPAAGPRPGGAGHTAPSPRWSSCRPPPAPSDRWHRCRTASPPRCPPATPCPHGPAPARSRRRPTGSARSVGRRDLPARCAARPTRYAPDAPPSDRAPPVRRVRDRCRCRWTPRARCRRAWRAGRGPGRSCRRRCNRAIAAAGMWQRMPWPPPRLRQGGGSSQTGPMRRWHRVANRQPGPAGASPGSPARRMRRVVPPIVGTADSSASVYGWCGGCSTAVQRDRSP